MLKIARHCTADPSSNGTAQKAIGRRTEAEFASRTVSNSGSVREEQSHMKLGRSKQTENSKQSDGRDVLMVDSHQPSECQNSESTSLNESTKASFLTASTARSSEPGLSTFHSTSSRQKSPKLIENMEFEKLCTAYKASSNTSQNFDSTPSVVRNEPLVPGGLSKHKPAPAKSTSVVTDSPPSNLAHRDLSRTSLVSSSGSNIDVNHQTNGAKQRTLFSDDRMDIDVQSPGDQHDAHDEDMSSAATFVTDSLNGFSPYQHASSVPVSASQPRPSPGIKHIHEDYCQCCAPIASICTLLGL